MATSVTVDQFQLYDNVVMEIKNIFNHLIEQLLEKRDALLTKLKTMKEGFVTKEKTRKASMTELEKVMQQVKEEAIKLNTNFKVKEKAIEVFREEIEQHQTPTRLPQPFFSYPTFNQLQAQIADFGEVREWELDYSLKKQPVLAIGKEGKANNQLDVAKGLALDEPNQLVYIADSGNSRIQVVSFAGKFLRRFGQGVIASPWGIAITEYFVFVTDISHHGLFQFSKKDYQQVRETGTKGGGEGQLTEPKGLCIDHNGDVYVADSGNNRVSVFSKYLKFLKHLITEQLISPCDVKVCPIKVVVLDWSPNCIHFFSRSGAILSSCVIQGKGGIVRTPLFFCLDTVGNILITDFRRHNIKILSPTGQLIHTIGKEGHGKGEMFVPLGICSSQLGNVLVLSSNRNFCLQYF